MESVKSTSQTTSQQGVAAPTPTPSASSGNAEFDKTLKVVLGEDPAKKVSEEDLFSALVSERIKKTKGDEQGSKFQEVLEAKKNSMKKGDGYVPMEDATKAALIEARDTGLLTKEETDKIYSEAFAAAQLDDNKGALFDGRGGANDVTVAVASLEQALAGSRALIEKYSSGSEKAPERSVDEASNSKVMNIPGAPTAGDQGFLYKPVSDSDGKLAVLLPSRLSGLIAGVQLFDPAGKLLDSGRYGGNGNGGRDHYRFSKAGGSYPDGVSVEVSLKTGEKLRYVIGDSSQRVENINPQNDAPSTGGGTGENSSGSSDSSSNQSGSLESSHSL
jgi:hypothetical protein